MTLPEHEFVFLRHGETEFNRERRLQGHIDVPLNETGLAQAAAASELLQQHRISRVVASPALRVQQTIKPFLQIAGTPLHIEENLMEYFVGSFEGRLAEEIHAEYDLDEGAWWWSVLPEDAEHWPSFVHRVVTSVAEWTQQHAGETLLIASHGLVFRALAETLTGQEVYSQNAQPQHFRKVNGDWHVSPLQIV